MAQECLPNKKISKYKMACLNDMLPKKVQNKKWHVVIKIECRKKNVKLKKSEASPKKVKNVGTNNA